MVSIVIPVYNGSNYLKQAIDSALVQTYPRVEVLVINDGSTDDGLSEQIALGYGQRIRYFSKPNGGVASALNIGLQQMHGEWFAWLSHDDVFTPNRLANDMQVVRNHPEARVIFCRVETINAAGRVTGKIMYPIEQVTNPRQALILGGINMCAMTIHRDCFKAVGLFNEKNSTIQDTEMSLRLAAAFSFFLDPQVGLYSRDHSGRGTYLLSEQHRQDLRKLCQVIHDELKIGAFFPDLSEHPEKGPAAWTWMGSQYLSFGGRDYAAESFRNALAACKTFPQQIVTGLRITALWMAKTLLSKQIRFKLKTYLQFITRGT
ncbi:MAG: glycosyltransferase [Chloroflexota bacterium]